ncbi:7035_t:CDS:10 [Funneliformis caledonium]|uniref:7035_t:CDS:1 n=1 Tax=Funneliformis caledonium TaxID=1117310 RepID=A0A9N8ZGR6_9GLOM|nr:7035_t:CDS:10 [Funneliformis caledonium]
MLPSENPLVHLNTGRSVIAEESLSSQDIEDTNSPGSPTTCTDQQNQDLKTNSFIYDNVSDGQPINNNSLISGFNISSQSGFAFKQILNWNLSANSNQVVNEAGSENNKNIVSVNDDDVENLNDLAEFIPGLYRLLDLCKDDGSNGLVDKIIISKEGLKNLCNDYVKNSFKSISDIDYNQLNSCTMRLIGFYGNHVLIAKLLLNKDIIDQKLYEMLIHSSQQASNIQESDNKLSLRPGIYFLKMNLDLGLVIHWSEYGCYDDNASSQRKKNMINLHRYVTKLTDYQICLMSDQDLNSFDWEKDNDDEVLNYDNKMCVEFEVKKSQEEQEDFKVFNGFNISLPKIIKSEIEKSYNDELYPKGTAIINFNKEFMNRWGKCSVRIDRSTMNMKMLEILINYGLNMDDLKEQLNQYQDALKEAKKELESKKENERLTIQEDAKTLKKLAYNKLEELYGRLEDDIHLNIEIEKFFSKYSDLKVKFDAALIIEWQQLKRRFIYGSLLIREVQTQASNNDKLDINEVNEAIWQTMYNMLTYPKVLSCSQIYKDYFKHLGQKSIMTHKFTFEIPDNQINEYDKQASSSFNSSDSEIIEKLFSQELCPNNSELRKKIIDLFRNRYNQWKNNIFSKDIDKIEPKWTDHKKKITENLGVEHETLKRNIERNAYEILCSLIEARFPDGPLFKIKNISSNSYILFRNFTNYTINYELDTVQPERLQITIYETVLEQEDCLKIQEDEFHIPNPKLSTRANGKYDLTTSIRIDNPKMFRNLQTGKDCLIAVNESKGLIAIYDFSHGKLNVYTFDEDQVHLYPRNSNIQILGWYNNSVPDIRHFLFIKDTEELCFVEKSGRARIYNLVNGQFRAGVSQFPSESTAILSTPDGACIVAFVKEPQKSIELLDDESAHRQIHLTTFDINNSVFHSVIVKITLEKTQYRFQQLSRKKSLGQVKFESITSDNDSDESIIIGSNTNFTRDIKEGENIVIMGERHRITEVISDERLKLAGNISSILGIKSWQDFRIEPKAKLNGFIDSYKLMFEKYPIDSCIDIEQNRPLSLHIVLDVLHDKDVDEYSTKFEDYILDMFKDLKRETNKPQTILKKFSIFVTSFQEFDIEDLINAKRKKIANVQLGEWIIQLSCLIPIQIAVAKNNQFQPLRDGLSENGRFGLDDGYRPVDSIARNISFGWYEGILNYFGDRQVKVVSSMGEQSCGKSYLLNHLVGSTFDGSAMRCTEGVWMSLVITKKFIYVALDFEGLKSLERTPQEESICYQSRFVVDVPKISRWCNVAKLCVIIKDVPKNDRSDVVREFYSRFEQLVTEEGEDNFITKMYKGGLNIMPWPIFNDAAWFKALTEVKSILDEQESKYENARIFLQNIKVIMAKLKVCDWGSLDENLVQNRVSTLKRLLYNAVFLGIEQKDLTVVNLTNRDTGKEIDDPIIFISEIFDDLREKEAELTLDSELILFEENTNFIHLSTDLRTYFEDKIQLRKQSSNDTEWFNSLEKFFKYIIDRRIVRVQEWFNQNTIRFPQDNSDIVIANYTLEQEISKLTIFWTLCGLTCQSCGHKAGHEGKHACNKANHLCGKRCHLSEKRNCQKICAKKIGHEDDNHLCQSSRHNCGEPCSLNTHTIKGSYQCSNKCIIPHEVEHNIHKCENETCPIQCPIKDCQRRCQSNDHFHALSGVNHFCGNEHKCLEDCEQPGICKVHIEPQKQEEIYQGLVQDTSIAFTKCSKKIPPNEFKHDGPHIHDNFHFCDVKCPFCEYYCTLPYGHTQKHETKHGNMIQTEFTSERDEFEYGGHKLRIGDKGTFLLCNLVCKELGRHRHIDYCQKTCRFGNLGQDIKHIYGEISPNPEMEKDYVSHRLFWEHPYSSQELQEFVKCDHECRDEIHNRPQDTSNTTLFAKSYCELPLFHLPLKENSPLPNGMGYISLDGHHFTCENPSTREAAFHIIFALDRSSSMNTVSIILFDEQAVVPYVNQSLTDANIIMKNLVQYFPSVGTNFDAAIEKAGNIIDTNFDPTKANIIIFLSDGGCAIPESRLKSICKHNQSKKSPLYLYTVLFSSRTYSSSLERMAKVAQSYHPPNPSSVALRCQFTRAIDEVKLVDHFTSVAASLRKHKPALLKRSVL